jgi:hypothetical protein
MHNDSNPRIALNSLPEDVMLGIALAGAGKVDEDLNCIERGGARHSRRSWSITTKPKEADGLASRVRAAQC